MTNDITYKQPCPKHAAVREVHKGPSSALTFLALDGLHFDFVRNLYC